MFRVSVLALALLSAGCVSLDPTYQRPDAPVPAPSQLGRVRRPEGPGSVGVVLTLLIMLVTAIQFQLSKRFVFYG